MGTEETKNVAESFKLQANELFKNQKFNESIAMYTKAIEADPNVAVYYANRSFAYLKTECFGYALADATKAIQLDKNYVKGYYRRAASYMSLGKFKLALRDFESVTKARPKDKDAKLKYQECSKMVKRLAFEKAIAISDKSVAELIDFDSINIEDEYTGPCLENETTVTVKFVNELMETYKKLGKLHRKYAYKILIDVKAFLEKESSLVDICVEEGAKFTICGDIHGQFFDLMNIFKINGVPSEENPYLFNGDFVDRGSFSVECIFTLFAFKLLYPRHFYMSRGNHESSTMNQMYGFEGEVKAKYTAQMADLFTEVFNWLPLAHCINSRILVMHGGLFSEDGVSLSDIAKTDRDRQPPEQGLMCDILWSDPQPGEGRAPSKRGVGIQFGPDVTATFCKANKLDFIVRSHEVKQEGYEVAHNGQCITVFSAPNYCDTMGNKGAIITLKGGDTMQPKFVTFEAVEHPNVRPMAYASSLLSLLS